MLFGMVWLKKIFLLIRTLESSQFESVEQK